MEQFWRKKSFKILQKEWEQKLIESGFVDIELNLKDERVLKQNSSNSYRQASEIEKEARIEYYTLLGHKTYNTEKLDKKDNDLKLFAYYSFSSDMEQLILTMYSKGALIEEIVKELKNIGISRDRKTIRYIIRRWQMKWGIKSWSLREMNLKK